eukprot:scaffold2808_cov255-Pinguiococcus_pyrenoidosus.AAC.35
MLRLGLGHRGDPRRPVDGNDESVAVRSRIKLCQKLAQPAKNEYIRKTKSSATTTKTRKTKRASSPHPSSCVSMGVYLSSWEQSCTPPQEAALSRPV